MIERDPRLADALDHLVPSFVGKTGDWERVLRDARSSRRRFILVRRARGRRRCSAFAVAAAALVAILGAVPAIGGRGWWFLGDHAPKPAGDIVTVASGTATGLEWKLVAFVGDSEGLCMALSSDDDSGRGAEGCGMPVRGAPRKPTDTPPAQWVGFVYTSGLTKRGTEPVGFVFGPVARGVARVHVELAHRTLQATVVDPPSGFGADVRFYFSEVPAPMSGEPPVRAVVARGER